MPFLEQFFKYSQNNQQQLIMFLLGLIMIGTIAGGIWISNLTGILDEREGLEAQRIALVESQNEFEKKLNEIRVKEKELEFKQVALFFYQASDSILAQTKELKGELIKTNQSAKKELEIQIKMIHNIEANIHALDYYFEEASGISLYNKINKDKFLKSRQLKSAIDSIKQSILNSEKYKDRIEQDSLINAKIIEIHQKSKKSISILLVAIVFSLTISFTLAYLLIKLTKR